MTVWTVRVVVAIPDKLCDEALDELADRADLEDGGVARWAGGVGLVFTVDVTRSDPLQAAAWVRAWVGELVRGTIVDLRVCTPEIYEADAFRPDTPELLAASDVAELLGVSRQRVHQLLSDHPTFPAPYTRLGSGPIWSRPAVEHFNAEWARKPGRPAKAG